MSDQSTTTEAPTTYAIVESGGKQYRVSEGEAIVVDRVAEAEGASVSLRAVMFRDPERIVIEPTETSEISVSATVAEHFRGEKIRVATYKSKKGSSRAMGHRSELTKLEVTSVALGGGKPKSEPAADKENSDGA